MTAYIRQYPNYNKCYWKAKNQYTIQEIERIKNEIDLETIVNKSNEIFSLEPNCGEVNYILGKTKELIGDINEADWLFKIAFAMYRVNVKNNTLAEDYDTAMDFFIDYALHFFEQEMRTPANDAYHKEFYPSQGLLCLDVPIEVIKSPVSDSKRIYLMESYLYKGKYYLEHNKYSLAYEKLNRGISFAQKSLNKREADCYISLNQLLGETLIEMSDINGALNAFTRIVEFRSSIYALYLRGSLYCHIGNKDEMATDYLNAIMMGINKLSKHETFTEVDLFSIPHMGEQLLEFYKQEKDYEMAYKVSDYTLLFCEISINTGIDDRISKELINKLKRELSELKRLDELSRLPSPSHLSLASAPLQSQECASSSSGSSIRRSSGSSIHSSPSNNYRSSSGSSSSRPIGRPIHSSPPASRPNLSRPNFVVPPQMARMAPALKFAGVRKNLNRMRPH